MATICAVQSSAVALTEATEPVAPEAMAVLSHNSAVGRIAVPGVPVTRLVNPDGMVVATAVPRLLLLFMEKPNQSSNSLLPATVRPVAVGFTEGVAALLAPTTSIEHGPAIVALTISATPAPLTEVTV